MVCGLWTVVKGRTVFTTQPTDHSYKHDQYWVGGVLPRLGQHTNTLLAVYNPALLVQLVFNTSITHAHFHRAGYDEVRELTLQSSQIRPEILINTRLT